MTQVQKQLISDLILTEVFYHDFSETELGYATKGKESYEIHLNESLEGRTKDIVLIHEAGHIDLGHCKDISQNDLELAGIAKTKCEDFGVSDVYEMFPLYDPETEYEYGSLHFLGNVAMDLEVNSKYLTFSDLRYMKEQDCSLVSLETMKVDYQEDYKEYFKRILNRCEKLPDMGMPKEGDSSNPGMNLGDVSENEFPGGNKYEPESLGKALSDEAQKEIGASSGAEVTPCNFLPNGLGSPAEARLEKSEVNDTERIKEFIKSLFETHRIKNVDSMKLYNRGSRSNPDGIIYSSYSRKVKRDNMSLMIIIDVSGSMDTVSINTALESLEQMLVEMNSSTPIVHWGNRLIQTYPIRDIKRVEKKRTTAGICYNCLDYARQRGYKNVVLYSDFLDDRSYSFEEQAKGLNVYSIVKMYHGITFEDFQEFNSEVVKYSKDILVLGE